MSLIAVLLRSYWIKRRQQRRRQVIEEMLYQWLSGTEQNNHNSLYGSNDGSQFQNQEQFMDSFPTFEDFSRSLEGKTFSPNIFLLIES